MQNKATMVTYRNGLYTMALIIGQSNRSVSICNPLSFRQRECICHTVQCCFVVACVKFFGHRKMATKNIHVQFSLSFPLDGKIENYRKLYLAKSTTTNYLAFRFRHGHTQGRCGCFPQGKHLRCHNKINWAKQPAHRRWQQHHGVITHFYSPKRLL